MILKIGMQLPGLKLYNVYINDGPGLTLTYFTARLNWAAYTFEWGKLLQCYLMGENLQQRTKMTDNCVYENKFTPGGCLPLPWAKFMYMTIIFKHHL